MITDYFGKELSIGDSVIYLGISSRSAIFKRGKVVDINTSKDYGLCVHVLGDNKSRPGWTYPGKCINLKYIELKNNA